MRLSGRQQAAVVFTLAVPKAWREVSGPLDEGASALGLFLKLAAEPNRPDRPVFVAPRVAWHPAGALGDLGMDVGLLDNVQNKMRITGREREGFYQMLAAVGRAGPGQLLRKANHELIRAGQKRFSVVPLFLKPDQQIGRLVVLSGKVRRVTRIRVSDPDIVARFGIDHYYEMALFTEDSEGNPITFCVRELPQGMPHGDDPQFAEQVTVAGFYYKLWLYRAARPPDADTPQGGRRFRGQRSPLLIGRSPVWHRAEPPAPNRLAGAIAGGLFLLALAGIWFALWRFSRSDKKFRNQTIAKAVGADQDILPDEQWPEGDDAPDFSYLLEMDRPGSGEKGEQRDGGR
jgi:hypothetical protein